MKSEYNNNGYYLIESALDNDIVSRLIAELSVFEKEMNNYGIRNLMNKVPYIRELANSTHLLSVVCEILGDKAKPVRSVFFDKVPEANWNVAWHQDTSIAVKSRHAATGFGPWSIKQGVVHVEPPVEYLANTLTLRIHLDETNSESGVLRVVAGTHSKGRISSKQILDTVEHAEIIECNAKPGDVLLMSPLLFHSSRKATAPSHRRIVHIEYTALALPTPLEWYESA